MLLTLHSQPVIIHCVVCPSLGVHFHRKFQCEQSITCTDVAIVEALLFFNSEECSMVNDYCTPGKHLIHELYHDYLKKKKKKKKKMFMLLFSSVFPHFTQFEETQKELPAVFMLDRWSIKALKGDFAMAAVLLHPIIMSCEKHINLGVDKNMCARTSFPPHHLAALISFM